MTRPRVNLPPMQVHRDMSAMPELRRAVVTIGSFDGVHLGHQALLSRITSLAANSGGESVVITFDPHPRTIIGGGGPPVRLLTTTAEKIERLEACGIDHVAIVPFTREFALQTAEEYLHDFLFGVFHPADVVIGYDHRFGVGRKGNVAQLRTVAGELGARVHEIPAEDVEALAVSSTRIRKAVDLGEVRRATRLLGSPYWLTGRVVHGEAIGRTIGFPTANLDLGSTEKLLPADGVYACRVRRLDHVGEALAAMLYIGERPSLAGRRPRSIEANILDFDADLYGQMMRVELVERVREDQAFSGLPELRDQIAKDGAAIRKILRV